MEMGEIFGHLMLCAVRVIRPLHLIIFHCFFSSPKGEPLQSRTTVVHRLFAAHVSVATASSIPAKLEYVVHQGYISRNCLIHFHDLTYILSDISGI
jgi:hypothetical protein